MFLETLKQVKRDDFVSRKTAIEDHQSKSFFLLCYIFFSSDMEKQTPMQRPSEVETVFKEYTRDIMDAKYKTFVVMN